MNFAPNTLHENIVPVEQSVLYIRHADPNDPPSGSYLIKNSQIYTEQFRLILHYFFKILHRKLCPGNYASLLQHPRPHIRWSNSTSESDKQWKALSSIIIINYN